jgi:hypothetical protein
MTVAPLIRLLNIDDHDAQQRELIQSRRLLAEVALRSLADEPSATELGVRRMFNIEHEAWSADGQSAEKDARRKLIRKALDAQRLALRRLHEENDVSEETFLTLQQELDWKQLSLSTADAQMIEET